MDLDDRTARKMAEPLKNFFNERVPLALSARIGAVWPAFNGEAFVRDVLAGDYYEALGLMDRGRHVARALRNYLPARYSDALDILMRSVGDRPVRTEGDGGMASFHYLPHTSFVEEFGLEDFDASMKALYLLTQRFTAEFAVRPFIERYEAESLALLREWAQDRDLHVRRLVSEGTRSRLPWAARLRRFQKDPAPVLALLEILRDDPEEFVRRSVANNLNDIGKDHPDILLDTARRWMVDAGEERRSLVRHALRTLVRQGHAEALDILGYGDAPKIAIEAVAIVPNEVAKGDDLKIEFSIVSKSPRRQRILVDLRVHYMRSNGRTTPKVFKLKVLDLQPGGTARLRKSLSLADLTTRRHYAGGHRVEALINGKCEPLGTFMVTESAS